MAFDRNKLFWIMADSNMKPHIPCFDIGDYSREWLNPCNIAPSDIDKDLIVNFDSKEVCRIEKKRSFFHCMNYRASTSGDTMEVAIFGYFDSDKARYLIIDDTGSLIENSWFEDSAERFAPFKNLESSN